MSTRKFSTTSDEEAFSGCSHVGTIEVPLNILVSVFGKSEVDAEYCKWFIEWDDFTLTVIRGPVEREQGKAVWHNSKSWEVLGNSPRGLDHAVKHLTIEMLRWSRD